MNLTPKENVLDFFINPSLQNANDPSLVPAVKLRAVLRVCHSVIQDRKPLELAR